MGKYIPRFEGTEAYYKAIIEDSAKNAMVIINHLMSLPKSSMILYCLQEKDQVPYYSIQSLLKWPQSTSLTLCPAAPPLSQLYLSPDILRALGGSQGQVLLI